MMLWPGWPRRGRVSAHQAVTEKTSDQDAGGTSTRVRFRDRAHAASSSARRVRTRRVAQHGEGLPRVRYSVLCRPYYRIGKAPMWEDASKVDFATERPKLNPMMQSINAAGTVEKDAPAFIAWLDQQPQVDRTKKVGTQGYCMGGALVMRTAAAVPDRVGAGASFHGGGLVTQTPNAPLSHLIKPEYFASRQRRKGRPTRRHVEAASSGQGPRVECTTWRSTAGACPTCRTICTARLTRSARGASCSRYTKRRSRKLEPRSSRRPRSKDR